VSAGSVHLDIDNSGACFVPSVEAHAAATVVDAATQAAPTSLIAEIRVAGFLARSQLTTRGVDRILGRPSR
jgi:hypothetical protein